MNDKPKMRPPLMPKIKYIKHKLSAEEITVIKHALYQFQTKELENEREEVIKRLQHKDFFLCMYSAARVRDRGKNEKE